MVIVRKDTIHTFDQEIPTCPTHGLSITSEFLCAVCIIELSGKSPGDYRKYESGISGIPQVLDEETGKMKPAYIAGNDKYFMANKRKQDKHDAAVEKAIADQNVEKLTRKKKKNKRKKV